MPLFLCDRVLPTVTVDLERLRQVSDLLLEIAGRFNSTPVPEGAQRPPPLYVYYVLRFDHNGYKFFSFDELAKYYVRAKLVEKVTLGLEALGSDDQNKLGLSVEVRLEDVSQGRSFLKVTGDDRLIVEAAFSTLSEVLESFKNWNRVRYWGGMKALGQLSGLAVVFLLSLWAASKLAPQLAIENAFAFSFFFVLLTLSNLWGYFAVLIGGLVAKLLPNVRFQRVATQRHWMAQALLGSLAFAAAAYLLSLFGSFLLEALAAILSKAAG